MSLLLVISLGVALSPSVNASNDKLEGLEMDFREQVVEHCQSSDNKVECLVEHGEIIREARRNSYIDGFDSVISDCLSYYENNHSNFQSKSILVCVNSQSDILSTNNHPYARGLFFQVDRYRASWLSACIQSEGSKSHSRCLREKELHFNTFWGSYISNEFNSLGESAFNRCLGMAGSRFDFSLTNSCLGM